MRVLRPPVASPAPARSLPAVATAGMFDGVHLGHQALLEELCAWARETGSEPKVITFERHPLEALGRPAPPIVSSLEHRLLLLARQGIAETLVLPFDEDLARLEAEDFLARHVRGSLGASRFLLGFDSAIGRGRRGTVEALAPRSSVTGVEVRRARERRLSGERVSSTLVREALRAGDLPRLERLLARPFSLLGPVTRGDGRGRSLGFPTANIDVGEAGLPPLGVYAARVLLLGGSLEEVLRATPGQESPVALPAVINVGKRPTFKDPTRAEATVEAHVLDWRGDLYGRWLEVQLLRRERGEIRFNSADELRARIEADISAARAFLATELGARRPE